MKRTTDLELGYETVVAFLSKIVMAVAGFAASIIFARTLGSDGLGIYWTAVSAAAIISKLPGGVGTAIQKRVSEVDVDPSVFLGTGLVVHVAYSAFVFGLFAVFRQFTAQYFGSLLIAFATAGVGASVGLFSIVNRMYAGIGYPGKSAWIDAARTYVMLALQLALLWYGYDAFGLVLGFLLGTAVTAGISLVAAGVVPTLPERDAALRVWSFARWSIPGDLLNSIYNKADVLLLRAVVGVSSAGLYAAAIQLTKPATYLSGSIGDALQVKSSGLDSVGGDVRADLINSVSYVGLIAIPMFFGALAMPRSLMVTFFGGEFRAGWTALVGLAAYQVFNVYRTPFEAVVRGSDLPEYITRINLITLVVYLPVVYVLGALYGLNGVVAATAATEGFRVALYQLLANQHFGGTVLPRPSLDQVVSGAIMYAVLRAALDTVVTVTAWYVLGVVIAFGAAVYFGSLLVVSSHFRHTLDDVLGQYGVPSIFGW